jgi:hypothetical protein
MLPHSLQHPSDLINGSVVTVDDFAVKAIVEQSFNNRTGPAVMRQEQTSAIDPAIL